MKNLKAAVKNAEEARSLNSLIYSVCRGPAYKKGATVVAGVLHHTQAIETIASIGKHVSCFESSGASIESSVFAGIKTFRLPLPPKNADFYVDADPVLKDVGTLFLFEAVPFSCDSFVPSAIIVGTEPLLREALNGLTFFPRAKFAGYAAMEIF